MGRRRKAVIRKAALNRDAFMEANKAFCRKIKRISKGGGINGERGRE